MAIGAIGNAIFVNQQTASVASLKTEQNNRLDFQNMAAQAIANEKDEEVMEVRPTEENKEVDPDREHQREEADENTKRAKKENGVNEEESEEEEQNTSSVHRLDIKV